MGKQCSFINVNFLLSLSSIIVLRGWYLADAEGNGLLRVRSASSGWPNVLALSSCIYFSSSSGVWYKILESASKYHGSLVTYQLEIDHCY